ncbi:MAG TPA: hypothetical protein VKD22_07880 [Ramlibacter sp.]|nr:hypothetical protein [Ramlibacter sp.]
MKGAQPPRPSTKNVPRTPIRNVPRNPLQAPAPRPPLLTLPEGGMHDPSF